MKLGLSGDAVHDEHDELNHAGVLRSFGDYELLEEVARGGMGVVYRARQKSLNREVAVKLLLGGQLATPQTVQRFQIEAEAAARLDHPGIVPIYEVGKYESQHFMSMKLVEGPNLQESISLFCITSEMSARQVLEANRKIARVTRKIADAVNFAHEHGVLHRDLKPNNILLESDEEPLISDFGLAKIADANQTGITATFAVLGSPAHMSPEQACGHSDLVTTATDVYGVGGILYSLLTGKAPFVGNTALEAIRAVTDTEPVPPRKLNPLVNRDLETIALKCLEKEPDKRFPSVSELAHELQRFLDGHTIVSRPASSLERLSKYCRRNPVVSALLVLMLMITVAGVIGVASQWRSAIAASRRADENASNAVEQRDKALWETYRSRIALAANAIDMNQTDVALAALQAAPEGYRNWEWEQFQGQLGTPFEEYERSLPGLPAGLWFSEDGSRLCLSLGLEFEGGVHQTSVWNTENRSLILEEASDSVLSQDFTKLAVRGDHGAVIIKDLSSGESKSITHSKSALLYLVSFASPSNDLATRSEAGLQVWDSDSNVEKYRLAGGPDAFYGRRFWEMDGRQFLYQGGNALNCYDDLAGELDWTANLSNAEVHTIAICKAARLLAISREYPNNAAELWDAETGERTATLRGHRNVVFRMKFSPSGRLLATGSPDKTVRVWDTEKGNQQLLLSGHRDDILDLAFDNSGRLLASSALDGTVRIWNTETGQQEGTISTNAQKLAFHPSKALLVTADSVGRVRQWDLEAVTRQQWTGHSGFVYGLALHPQHNILASTGWDKSLRIWNTASGETEKVIDLQQLGFGVSFSANGEYLAVATPLNLKIFRVEDWAQMGKAEIRSYDIGTQAGVRPDFHPNGTLVACGDDHTPVIYKAPTGEVQAKLQRHNGTVTDCRFVGDGRILLTVGGTLIRFHDVASAKTQTSVQIPGVILSLGLNRSQTQFCVSSTLNVVHLFRTADASKPSASLQHSSKPYSMVFSKDDTRLFVGCHDGTIRVWDLTKFEQVATLRGHEDYVHAIAIDELDTLYSGSGDFTLRKWVR